MRNTASRTLKKTVIENATPYRSLTIEFTYRQAASQFGSTWDRFATEVRDARGWRIDWGSYM
jgi:hypothetical protein